jgi:hypothetical protein
MKVCVESTVQDAFLRLQYRLPLLTSEPSKCCVSIGPLDAIYCQVSLICMASFLDKAWPVPDLDPLAIKASVSLREVVRETIRSTQLPTVEAQSLPGLQVQHSTFLYKPLLPSRDPERRTQLELW